MKTRELRRHLRHNPALKQWLKANNQWFKEHPQAFASMIKNPSFLSSFNQTMQKNRRRIQRQMQHTQRNPMSAKSTPLKQKPKLKLPSLSTLNEKISQTSEFIHGIQSFMRNVK